MRTETETPANKRLRWFAIIFLLIVGPIVATCTTKHSFLQSDTLPQFLPTESLSCNEVVHLLRGSVFCYNEVVYFITTR
jgi:hypothetical protein